MRAIEELARHEGIGLLDAVGLLHHATAMAMSVPELQALHGLQEQFSALDAATGDPNGKVSLSDLRFIVRNPNRFDVHMVAAAAALLANEPLLQRLDTATDNSEIVRRDGVFGDAEFDDGVVSRSDIDSFLFKQGLSHFIGLNYDQIDASTPSAEADGRLSKANFEAFLSQHRASLTDAEVQAFETVINGELYDKGWWERNKRSIALVTAVAAGATFALVTGGLGSGLSGALITMAATGASGSAAAALTTMEINKYSDESDWHDDVASNGFDGFFAGAGGGGAGLGVNALRVTSTTTAGRAAIALGITSDTTGLAGMGTFDVGLQYAPGLGGENLDDTKHAANIVSIATGLTLSLIHI